MPDAIPITLTPPPADSIVAAVVAAATPPASAPPVTPPVVAPVAEPKPEAQDPVRITERLAQLARREQSFVQEQRKRSDAVKAQEQAVKAREDALAAQRARVDEWEKLQAEALKNPAALLRKVYGDNWYDRLTQYKLEGETPPPDMAVQQVRDETQAEIAKLRAEQQAERERLETERRTQSEEAAKALAAQEQAVIDQFHAETIDFVKAHPDDYELTNLNDAQGLVVQVIEQTFLKTKKVMSAKEAAEAVEKHLEGVAAKNFDSKKWKARTAPPAEPKPATETPKTLTNDMAASPSMPAAGGDKWARAVAAMEAAEASRRNA